MLIFYIALFLLALWNIKFSGKNFFKEESFSRDVTDSIKGIFIWLVFFSHFKGYAKYTTPLDLAGKEISTFLGQLIVACFLFYSGYGVCEAIKKKGTSYVKSIPKKRVFSTLVKFDIAVLIYLLIAVLRGKTYELKTILLSLVGWESVGNSNWYIFVILGLYLITFVSFIIVRKNLPVAALLTTILTGAFVIFLYVEKQSWWYDTAACYALGIWVSVFKDKILSFITKNNITWSLCALLSLGGFCATYLLPHKHLIGKIIYLSVAPFFCLVIMVLLTKFRISNKVLIFSGQYLFEIYILQRIPMIILKDLKVSEFNIYVFFVLCVAITIPLALIYRKLTSIKLSSLKKSK